jgi:hypothetical protein
MMVLDLHSFPHWRLCCNRCHLLIKLHGVKKLRCSSVSLKGWSRPDASPRLVQDRCASCGAKQLDFVFMPGESPFVEEELDEITGCIVCNERLNSLTEIVLGRQKHKEVIKKERASRGGRGRGGRGKRD